MLRRAAYSPNIKERADCSAALFTADGELLVQAEHIPVHLGSMPASVRAAIDAFGDRIEPGRPDRAQRPVRGRHAPERRHARRAVLRRRRARRLGREPRPPRRPRRHGAGLDAAGRDRDPAGGPAHPARPAHAGTSRRSSSPARARPTSGAATSTRSAARTGSASPASPSSRTSSRSTAPLAEVVDYGERRMRAALGGAARRAVPLRGRARLRRSASRAAVTDAGRRDGHRRRRRDHVRLHGHRRAAPGNVNAVEAVTVSAVAFALRSATDPTIPANGGALRPVHVIAPPGIDRRGASARRGRRRQRRGEPARRRRVPRRARARRARAASARRRRGR